MKKFFTVILGVLLSFSLLSVCACSGGNSGEDPAEKPEFIDGREVVSAEAVNSFEAVRLLGRTYLNASKQLSLSNAGTGVEVVFYGTELKATISPNNLQYFRVFVDGDREGTRNSTARKKEVALAQGLDEGVHTVRLVKCTSSQNGDFSVHSFATDGKFLRHEANRVKIEFVGDSITAGAGVFGVPSDEGSFANSDAAKGYAYLAAREFDADYSLVATEGICVKAKNTLNVNMLEMYMRVSSTQGKAYDFPYEHDIVVIGLGTNDSWYMGAHPEYTVEEFTADYADLLTLVRSKNPSAQIVCVYGMMGLSPNTEQAIQNAIADFKDDRVAYSALPARLNGAGQHPSAADAVEQSEALIKILKNYID